jgi:hypothetical protein
MTTTVSTDPGRAGARSWTFEAALTAVLVALAVALGFVLLSVPNVELLTFTVFASGAVLGCWRGALVGALAMAIYSGINPYGSGLAIPTLYAGQIAATAIAGLAGGLSARLWRPPRESRPGVAVRALAGGAFGFAATLVYQVAVIVGLAAAAPEFRTGVLAAVVSNAFFSAIHLVSNTVIFAVLAPVALPRLGGLAAGAGRR